MDGKQSTVNDSARDAAGGETYVATTVFKLIEIWKKQKFFPTTSTFELSDSIVVFYRGLAQIWERAWTNLSTNCVFEMDITFQF